MTAWPLVLCVGYVITGICYSSISADEPKTGEANMQVCEHPLLQMQPWVCPKNNVKGSKIERGGPH